MGDRSSNTIKTIEVEAGNGDNQRIYHTRSPFTFRSADRAINRAYGHIAPQDLSDALMSIDGVDNIEVERYTVKIQKGKLFSWEEVEPSILEELKRFSGTRQ